MQPPQSILQETSQTIEMLHSCNSRRWKRVAGPSHNLEVRKPFLQEGNHRQFSHAAPTQLKLRPASSRGSKQEQIVQAHLPNDRQIMQPLFCAPQAENCRSQALHLATQDDDGHSNSGMQSSPFEVAKSVERTNLESNIEA